MGFGSNGAILRVDLTAGTTTVETFDEAFYRPYPGGKALAAYHLLREMPTGADPLGPDNVLVLPAHQAPFYGLHVRLTQIIESHERALATLFEHLTEPRRAVDCSRVMFRRELTNDMLYMATGETLAPPQRRLLDIARSSGEGLLAVLNDVLDYAKIEADALSLHTAPTALPAVASRPGP